MRRRKMKVAASPRRRSRGFTLMEVLLVLVILVILGSMAGVFVRRAQQRGLLNAARTQISMLEDCLEFYQIDMLSYPATQDGLAALISPPSSTSDSSNNWAGPYIQGGVIPKDPWGSDYQYTLNPPDQFTIVSLGPDRTEGTEDDISSAPVVQ
jgi:general secretion pathway protein G